MVRASAKGSEQGPGSSNMPPPYDESASTGSGAGAVPDPGAIPVIMPGDTVIAVMGVTGAGKSKFISHFSAKAKPGDDLESCTQEVEIHESYVDGQKLFLIDTPGFDDTNRSDTEILRNIANWLNVACQNQVLLSGIVYLHRIQDNRLTGAAMKNLRMFKKLCGERFLPCVVLATTMWGNVPRDVAERREADLVSKKEFWADMVRAGSRVFRQDRDAESASAIVRHIIHNRAQIKLKIQEEMEAGANLGDTDAGREVHAEMEKLRRQHAEEMRSLRDDMAEAMRKGNLEAQEEIRQVRAEMERKMEQERAAAEALRVTADELQRERERELAEQAREWREKEFEFQQRMWEKASELEKERLRNEHAARIREMEYKAKLAENEAEWLRKQNKKDEDGCLVM